MQKTLSVRLRYLFLLNCDFSVLKGRREWEGKRKLTNNKNMRKMESVGIDTQWTLDIVYLTFEINFDDWNQLTELTFDI
jgi:hypothetical protein